MAAGGAGKAPASFTDAMGEVLMALTQAKLAPDAHMDVIMALEKVVVGVIKNPQQPGGAQPTGPAGGGAPPSEGGPPPGGPAPSPSPGGGPPPQAGPPQGGPEPHARIPQMDPDEMRRVISQSTGE